MSMNGQPSALFCAFCGEVMGVYEPLVAVSGDRSTVRTSRLNHRDAPDAGILVHEDCFAKSQPWNLESSG